MIHIETAAKLPRVESIRFISADPEQLRNIANYLEQKGNANDPKCHVVCHLTSDIAFIYKPVLSAGNLTALSLPHASRPVLDASP